MGFDLRPGTFGEQAAKSGVLFGGAGRALSAALFIFLSGMSVALLSG
jgi:hypothetical protein